MAEVEKAAEKPEEEESPAEDESNSDEDEVIPDIGGVPSLPAPSPKPPAHRFCGPSPAGHTLSRLCPPVLSWPCARHCRMLFGGDPSAVSPSLESALPKSQPRLSCFPWPLAPLCPHPSGVPLFIPAPSLFAASGPPEMGHPHASWGLAPGPRCLHGAVPDGPFLGADVEVDVDELSQEQVADLNKQATTYGMADGDFVRWGTWARNPPPLPCLRDSPPATVRSCPTAPQGAFSHLLAQPQSASLRWEPVAFCKVLSSCQRTLRCLFSSDPWVGTPRTGVTCCLATPMYPLVPGCCGRTRRRPRPSSMPRPWRRRRPCTR